MKHQLTQQRKRLTPHPGLCGTATVVHWQAGLLPQSAHVKWNRGKMKISASVSGQNLNDSSVHVNPCDTPVQGVTSPGLQKPNNPERTTTTVVYWQAQEREAQYRIWVSCHFWIKALPDGALKYGTRCHAASLDLQISSSRPMMKADQRCKGFDWNSGLSGRDSCVLRHHGAPVSYHSQRKSSEKGGRWKYPPVYLVRKWLISPYQPLWYTCPRWNLTWTPEPKNPVWTTSSKF